MLGALISAFFLLPNVVSVPVIVAGLCFGVGQWWTFSTISYLHNERVTRDGNWDAPLAHQLEVARSIASYAFMGYLLLGLWSGDRTVVDVSVCVGASFTALKLTVTYFLVRALKNAANHD